MSINTRMRNRRALHRYRDAIGRMSQSMDADVRLVPDVWLMKNRALLLRYSKKGDLDARGLLQDFDEYRREIERVQRHR